MNSANEPAFPRPVSQYRSDNVAPDQEGISRLEYFAAAALTGILASEIAHEMAKATNSDVARFHAGLSAMAFLLAEALCREAEKRRKQ